jgi:hypothetical protein
VVPDPLGEEGIQESEMAGDDDELDREVPDNETAGAELAVLDGGIGNEEVEEDGEDEEDGEESSDDGLQEDDDDGMESGLDEPRRLLANGSAGDGVHKGERMWIPGELRRTGS